MGVVEFFEIMLHIICGLVVFGLGVGVLLVIIAVIAYEKDHRMDCRSCGNLAGMENSGGGCRKYVCNCKNVWPVIGVSHQNPVKHCHWWCPRDNFKEGQDNEPTD